MRFMYEAVCAFVKANILIVTLYVLATLGEAQQYYIIILGIAGIIWIMGPVFRFNHNYYNKEVKHNGKPKDN